MGAHLLNFFPATKVPARSRRLCCYPWCLSPSIQCYWDFPPFLLSTCKISTEQKVAVYIIMKKIISKQKFAWRKKNRRALEGTKLYSVSHPSIKLILFFCTLSFSLMIRTEWELSDFQCKIVFFFCLFCSCRRPASWKWGQFFHTLLFFHSLLTLTVAKCSSRQLGVFLFRFN